MEMLDTGATAWMLMSASLVLLMTPGLALFYGGMVRAHTVLNMMLMCFLAIGVVAIIWVLYGYSLAFGDSLGGFVGNPMTFLGLTSPDDSLSLLASSGVPFTVAAGFQMTFAIIAVAIVAGAIADRVKMRTWIAFAALWVSLAYFPMAHMVWGGGLLSHDGPLAALATPVDFAGGTVVHINAGIAGLILALIVGPRLGFGAGAMRPHNLPLVMLGTALLWFGWFGFNAGSAGSANATAGLAWMNTTVATAAAMCGWALVERIRDRAVTSLGVASGSVAGLVAITPGAAALTPVTSIAVGALTGALCALAIGLKFRFGIDDSLDVVGIHLTGGLVGTVLIGVFAADGGLLFGGGVNLLIVQTLVAVIALLYGGAVTTAIALLLTRVLGWRVSEAEERAGIDHTRHAESAYDLASSFAARLERQKPSALTTTPATAPPPPPGTPAMKDNGARHLEGVSA